MLLLLIFPVLVTGFYACHIHPVFSYTLHRYEGQYLYLKSAELGLRCFFLAFLLSLGFHYILPDRLTLGCINIPLTLSDAVVAGMKMMMAIPSDANGEQLSEASKAAWFIQLSFLTFLSAYLVKFFGHLSLRLRFGLWDAKVHVIGGILEDSPLDNLLFRLSLEKDKHAMLAMEDRKVYVGKIINLGEPSATTGMDQDIAIIPLMSGYRDKDTLKVTFTTFYDEVDADISISLRQDNIVSATQFDFDAYKVWNPHSAQTAEADEKTVAGWARTQIKKLDNWLESLGKDEKVAP
ncbi:hypothetical protein [Novosphingobium sp. PY1]|uniref:Transmembrane protein n=1 Tax=Ochrobactrum sp. PW1 TaxID=1882222 RepID=A0A292GN26_9HYPH|nr:hypothetical protein [Novosphingobium sp. PY1]BBA74564.1 hypothetical protein [Ochrobactrum sp. PW1]GFM29413.1 uncharacterized protein PY1_contig-07-339 [Novosphingobium sp. PY1]